MRHLTWTWIIMLEIAGAQVQPAVPRAISAETHLKQAAAYRSKGDSQRAIAELRQALELKPDLRMPTECWERSCWPRVSRRKRFRIWNERETFTGWPWD